MKKLLLLLPLIGCSPNVERDLCMSDYELYQWEIAYSQKQMTQGKLGSMAGSLLCRVDGAVEELYILEENFREDDEFYYLGMYSDRTGRKHEISLSKDWKECCLE